MEDKNGIASFSNGEITVWIEQSSSVHIRAVSPHGDPVELSSEETKELALHLLRVASIVE